MDTILITNIPTPYRIPLWDKLKESIPFDVTCISHMEKNRLWNIENRDYISFLKSYHFFISKMDWAIHFTIPFSLFFKLMIKNPDNLLITGYDSFAYLCNGSILVSSHYKNKIVNLSKRIIHEH